MYLQKTTSPENRAAAGYAKVSINTGSPQAVELQAFQKVTRMLVAAAKDDANFNDRVEAISLNSKLWLTLAGDVLSPGNQLPDALRAQIFNLAEYSRKQGQKALGDHKQIEPLVEINTAIMRGLRAQTQSKGAA